LRNERHQLVAVDNAAVLVDDHHAVGIAIERDADVGAIAVHLGDQRARVGGAAFRG
jgi:hypothetical protein